MDKNEIKLLNDQLDKQIKNAQELMGRMTFMQEEMKVQLWQLDQLAPLLNPAHYIKATIPAIHIFPDYDGELKIHCGPYVLDCMCDQGKITKIRALAGEKQLNFEPHEWAPIQQKINEVIKFDLAKPTGKIIKP